ncbi:hypothetical protein [Amycolatopsis sp. NPDC051903]|uniref:hypothetical protein n=1 Tax=Amycolatopsis sp. NPDC051903 TaxID=3363936 RepID=UPI0037B9A8FA
MGSRFLNTKMVVAVDPDVDVHDPRDLLYAMATRGRPDRDVITLGNTRGWPFDHSADPITAALPDTADTRYASLSGRWGIDATEPPQHHAPARTAYERDWPAHWGRVRLNGYLKNPVVEA